MNYNTLTPSPSASDGSCSPLSYTMMRDYNNITINETATNPGMPYLQILEQPVDKFRFRYKSEMGGTHGSLNGLNSKQNRKQTFPTVKLVNCNKSAIIRCSLYQMNERQAPEEWLPHAHRLVVKHGLEDIDDPHDKNVDRKLGYEAVFSNMGIIHTARKFLEVELKRKLTHLKLEALRLKGSPKLGSAAEAEINSQVREQAKTINLNIVCLRFDAFEKVNECLYPLCDPVYSHAINNLKSALTGELKIVRMDKCTSPASGNQEIYLLVEKVTKKNIKVRFFELDDDDVEIWCDYAKFNDIDVHHQYAIVIKTPPYKSTDIETERKVFIELHRPSDGGKSIPLEFFYHPEVYQRRKRMREENSCSSNYSSSELPTTIRTRVPEVPITSEDLHLYAQDVTSDEFQQILMQLPLDDVASFEELADHAFVATDTPAYKSRKLSNLSQITKIDHVENCRSEIVSLIKTNPPKERIIDMIKHRLNKERKEGNNALHLAHIHHKISNNRSHIEYFLELIRKYELYELLNLTNYDGQTILHIAIATEQLSNLKYLIKMMDLTVKNIDGNTVLHLAVMKDNYDVVVQLLKSEHVKKFIDLNNFERVSALQMALHRKQPNWKIFRDLCEAGADVKDVDHKDGNTLLHIAVKMGHDQIVTYLVERTNIDIVHQNYAGCDCQLLATKLAQDEPTPVRQKILKCIEDKLKTLGSYRAIHIKQEVESEDEMEIDFIKVEDVSEEDMTILYTSCMEITPECMARLSDILDEGEKWKDLCPLLDMEHVLKMKGLFMEGQSNTKILLDYALAIGITVYQIRRGLQQLNEFEAQRYLDDMVQRANKENT